jgi:hypothetical protein
MLEDSLDYGILVSPVPSAQAIEEEVSIPSSAPASSTTTPDQTEEEEEQQTTEEAPAPEEVPAPEEPPSDPEEEEDEEDDLLSWDAVYDEYRVGNQLWLMTYGGGPSGGYIID